MRAIELFSFSSDVKGYLDFISQCGLNSHKSFEESSRQGGPWCQCSVAILVVSCVFLLERGGRFLRVRHWSQEGSKVNRHVWGLVYFKYTPIFSFQITSTYVGLSL